jgi:hypothetical protein
MSIIHILISYHITILIYQANNIGDSFDHLGEIFSPAKKRLLRWNQCCWDAAFFFKLMEHSFLKGCGQPSNAKSEDDRIFCLNEAFVCTLE